MANQTRLDTDVTKPSVTAAGDGPHDTTDPTEMASTVVPRPGAQAIATGTVNAVLPIPKQQAEAPRRRRKEDIEEYEVTKPDGTKATVQHDLITGETAFKAAESTDTGSHRTQA
jgi:hypothetical protein